ncbi:RidA family protein [Adlercreutzia equolifaciens]|uniref:Reactive intermediate/imine deaminase n=1 Tax=Adlercreutzia equolifaciens subsp. celatus DSM 18785 TaxID=1121021 RepID=A0A3N0AU03_9ACTN|nr:RidA family protein [Adlercreutzia equolifaciens]MCP2077649.1 reactive intermediate/imine deaminase [Adlercreutzia equolifaciens subsp. celatus DSM 18785]RFT94168.1 reactive intermediate/imine deaminase [Adlercreutzia equolifaciens subsp. celatus]RNL38315.1 reactive intermediate/imine deaminase [Adlercreutzia equolifaciens subsp. celatus DSM 18785]BCS57917.1 reactive intermediate/imine deaminase [Adlercreutzia equolifaciens subsp. celatus]
MSDPNVVVARNTDKAPVSDLYSQTVAFSHYNNLSAQLPIDPATGAIVAGGAAEQAEQCFKNLQAIVESIGHDMNDIIRVSIFLADIMDLNAVEKVQASFFPTYQPARTVAAVDALPQGALVFIEALVDNGEGTQSVPQAGDLVKLTNNTHAAPYDAGSTQTVAFSHYNNITMQLPLDPGTGRPILGDVAAQTAQCLANVKAILTSVDVPFDDIVKVTIFVKNLADASVVDDVYKTFFPDSGIARAVNYLPARTVVPVKDLPYHCDVAVEAVVSHGDGTPPQAIEDRHGLIIEACNTDAAPKCPLATQSVAFSHYNNISAQLPLDLSGKLIDGTVAEQTAQCLAYVKAIVESVDHAVEDIVKVNVYLADIADLAAMNEAYAAFFGDHKPARKVVGCGELPFGARVMIDAIAGNWEGTPPVA